MLKIKLFIKNNVKLIGICIGVFVIGFTSTYLVLTKTNIFSKKTASAPATPQESQDFAPATEVTSEKGTYNALLLGYGGAGHEGSLLTDSIILVHVNTNNKTAAMISIPRDLWVNGNHKINAEASINGFQNEGGVIANVTGLHVDYFTAIDFTSFTKLIDSLGGITVNVPKTFDDPFYPIAGLENETCGKTLDEINALKAKYSDYQLETQFTCRYEHLHFDQGQTNLDGATALKFVRSRHGDSDFGRSERQFAVLRGILAKLVSLNALGSAKGVITNLLSMVKTNLNPTVINSLIQVVGDTGQYKINSIHLTTENVLTEGRSSAGAYILTPKAGNFNFSEVKKYILNNI